MKYVTTKNIKVKYITSDLINSPTLKNEFGSLNALLKIVLTEGFNQKKVESYLYDSSSKTATINLPLNHGFTVNTVIEIEGATESVFNGQFRVKTSEGVRITFELESTEGLSEASTASEITIKVAPLGYTIPYENEEEGVICFKNKSLKSPAILKSIDKLPPNGYNNSWAKFSRVVIGQSIDSSGEFINNLKVPYWNSYPEAEKTGNKIQGAVGIHGYTKWDYAIHNDYNFMETYAPVNNQFPTDWRIVGDDKTFYLMIRAMGKNRYSYNVLGFGNYIPENKKETFNICLQARQGPIAANQPWNSNFLRSGSNFGALDWDYSGHLFANIYGNVINQTREGIYRCTGLVFTGNHISQPWRTPYIKGILPFSGSCVTSKLYIKDADGYLRGYHRGIKIFYGDSNFPDNFSNDEGDLVLHVQAPMDTYSSEDVIQPLLFSLKDWEDV